MIRNKLNLAAVVAGLLFLMTFPLQAQLIDNFTHAEDQVSSPSDLGPSTTTTMMGGLIGGSRTLAILPPNGAVGTILAVDMNVLTHSQTNFAGSSKVTWDGDGMGLGGEDLTAMGTHNRISVRISSVVSGEADLSIMVEDTDMNSASLSRMDDLAAGVGFRDFLFTDFVDDQMDPVDFASIKSIMLQINADVSTEFTISLILSRGTNGNGNGVFATPEPSAFVLAALALTVGLGFTRFSHRRHRRSADTG